MKFLRTLEQVALRDRERPIYGVAALPEWEHYDPDDCPAPIRAWVQQHYPDVVVEQLVAEFEVAYVLGDESGNSGEFLNELTPIFRLGFNAEQAEHFERAWSNPPLDNLDSPSNFYFFTLDSLEAWQAKGVVSPHVPATVVPSGS
jgi:hypothetical protein